MSTPYNPNRGTMKFNEQVPPAFADVAVDCDDADKEVDMLLENTRQEIKREKENKL
jgi:hypothetical protein